MTTDQPGIDVDELRDLMRTAGMLPAIPTDLTTDATGGEALLRRILAEAHAGDAADGTDAPADDTLPAEPPLPTGTVTPLAAARRRRLGRTGRRVLSLAAAGAALLAAVLGTEFSAGPQAIAGTPAALVFSEGNALDVMAGHAASAAASLTALSTAASTAPAAKAARSAGSDVQRVATYAWLLEQDGGTGAISTVPTQSLWWVAPDGAVQLTQVRTGAITPDGRLDPTADVSVAGTTDTFPAGSLVPATLADLPRDAAGLTAELTTLAGGEWCTADEATHTVCLVTAAQQLFSQYVVPGDVAAAIWSVLADQPGVSDLGSTTDRFGRPGTAVAVAPAPGAAEAVTVLIVSPTDGQLLGVETIAVADAQGPVSPSVTGFTVWNTSSWVVALGD